MTDNTQNLPWRLDGRIALITGGSSGIGLGLAREMASLGSSGRTIPSAASARSTPTW
jgi:NAD(P)-dependent dehydrogenase (short-subunit alcohol dehydrogenase family)